MGRVLAQKCIWPRNRVTNDGEWSVTLSVIRRRRSRRKITNTDRSRKLIVSTTRNSKAPMPTCPCSQVQQAMESGCRRSVWPMLHDHSTKALTAAATGDPGRRFGHYGIRARQLQVSTTVCGEMAAGPSNSLRCATLVAMVQTANLWEGDNGAHTRRVLSAYFRSSKTTTRSGHSRRIEPCQLIGLATTSPRRVYPNC